MRKNKPIRRDMMASSDKIEKGSDQVSQHGLKVAVISLGCDKNRIDTEMYLGFLLSQGYLLIDDLSLADIIIINTCSFIEKAQQESINTLISTAATKKKYALLVAAGCMVETHGPDLLNSLPDLNGAIGVHSYSQIDNFLKILLRGKRLLIKDPPQNEYRTISARVLTTPAHSVNVKIAEGCNNHCHYCLIPMIRGPYRSRDPEEIVTEIKYLVTNGAREINLIAQDTTAYGSDNISGPDLTGLIQKILEIKEFFWLRLMYTYPTRVNNSLIELINSDARICNYIDLPIQHVNNQILHKMGRSYGRRTLVNLLTLLRELIPDLAVRTTCMVGFPGESRERFIELMEFITAYPFNHLGVFAYSHQNQNNRVRSDKLIPRRIAIKREREIMARQKKISLSLNHRLLNHKTDVLIDNILAVKENWYYGRTQYHAPSVDGGVYLFSKDPLKPGDIVKAVIRAVTPHALVAQNAGKWQLSCLRGK